MEKHKINCPFCGVEAWVDPDSRGHSVFCPRCGGEMTVDGRALSAPSGSAVLPPMIQPQPEPPATPPPLPPTDSEPGSE